MSKYKKESTNIKNTSKGWTKDKFEAKYYRKDNWVIMYHKDFGYWLIDESYEDGYYLTGKKQEFLKEKRKLAYKNTLVWKAMHGEYDNE